MVGLLLSWLPAIIGLVVIAVAIGFIISLAKEWRVVVPANEVHIVQRNKSSTAYGANLEAGNAYWKFPYWIPVVGTSVIALPISIFQIDLDGYEAYDQERVPFAVDVISFFQVENPVQAAKRITVGAEGHGQRALEDQLQNVLRGAVRKVLASKDINAIMETRSEMNTTFLAETQAQVANWGVRVMSIEFTDIHDAPSTHVITDIMNKKKSRIEKESRMEVADNMRDAQVKEIEAKQVSEIRAVEAQQAVEMRNAERQRQVGVAEQQAQQKVKEEEQKTKEKEVAVQRTLTVGAAEYRREEQVVNADAAAQAKVKQTQGNAESVRIDAEGYRSAQLLKAEGDAKLIGETGKAEADVIKSKAMAQAEGQIKMAEALALIQKEGLQAQLGEKAIEAHRAVGIALAAAYQNADIKAILTQGGGIEGLSDLLSAPGGAKLASFVEALKNTTGGKNIMEALGFKNLVPDTVAQTPPQGAQKK